MFEKISPARRRALDIGRDRSCLVIGPLGTYWRYRPKDVGGGGCQDQWDSAYLNSIAAKVKGLDINSEYVPLAREDGFDVEYGDAENFHLNEQFDVIFALHVIEHLGSPLALLQNCAGHLKPDGILVIETPNPFSCEALIKGALRGCAHSEPTHTCWIDAKQTQELANRAGLRIDSTAFNTPIDRRKVRYTMTSSLYRLGASLVSRLGSNTIFCCRADPNHQLSSKAASVSR
jgi:2-polyprenyl-3-methyl-5-hydroxy-6-metoxy-1,4-benzoquinol methylase